jgi:hypothetical protein
MGSQHFGIFIVINHFLRWLKKQSVSTSLRWVWMLKLYSAKLDSAWRIMNSVFVWYVPVVEAFRQLSPLCSTRQTLSFQAPCNPLGAPIKITVCPPVRAFERKNGWAIIKETLYRRVLWKIVQPLQFLLLSSWRQYQKAKAHVGLCVRCPLVLSANLLAGAPYCPSIQRSLVWSQKLINNRATRWFDFWGNSLAFERSRPRFEQSLITTINLWTEWRMNC